MSRRVDLVAWTREYVQENVVVVVLLLKLRRVVVGVGG